MPSSIILMLPSWRLKCHRFHPVSYGRLFARIHLNDDEPKRRDQHDQPVAERREDIGERVEESARDRVRGQKGRRRAQLR